MENPLKTYGLFGWNYAYLLTHPWKIAEECYYRTKWFIQRGWRGFADCDVWRLDSYLAEWMPEALERLQTNKIGHPMGMTCKGWNSRLECMKQGFLEARNIHEMNFKTIKESVMIQRKVKRGLDMFTKHYFSLWD